MSRLRDRLPVRIAVGFVGGVATVAVAMLVAAMRQHDGNSADKLHRSTTLIAVIGLVAAVALGVAAAVAITRPVRRTIEAARRFGAGELDVRLPTRGSTELAELSTAFNAMTTRLADTLRDLHVSQTLQQRFVADVSHELRTPLAAVIAAAEGLDAEDPRARQRSTELVRGQVRRLGKLVDDLLEMSRFDAGQVPMVYERIDVTALAVDVVHTVWPGEDVRITPLGDTTADADVRRVHTILRNLVANAFQHGQPPIDIVVNGSDPDTIVVSVADDGPGVPASVAPTIFDRFVRADESRTSDGEHSGLGLSIALENARLHGGTVSLSAIGRTSFSLRLPRHPPGTDVLPEVVADDHATA